MQNIRTKNDISNSACRMNEYFYIFFYSARTDAFKEFQQISFDFAVFYRKKDGVSTYRWGFIDKLWCYGTS